MSEPMYTENAEIIIKAAAEFGTPLYLYDEKTLIKKCNDVLTMPNAFGLRVRYAMKANPSRAILQAVDRLGLFIDASSLNEAKRAVMAGIAHDKIILTTQEIPTGNERADMEQMILRGMKYNVCSLRQLDLIAEFAAVNKIKLAIRVHPGVGAGESASRNTGDKYSCFGIHLSDIPKALALAEKRGIIFDHVHVHIGSGGESETWCENIDRQITIVKQFFHEATVISFGGGLKEARMPDEDSADIYDLGTHAKKRLEEFYKETGRKLVAEIEPGTYIAANMGCVITKVIDKKQTGEDGFNFIIADGGMEVNTRPLLYGSRHPFYVISKSGKLLSSEYDENSLKNAPEMVLVGTCCESGDSQSLDELGHIVPRRMAQPDVEDFIVIGGAGAYASGMSLYNYNSHTQIAEVMLHTDGSLKLIRKRQSVEQIIQNEI